MGVPGQERLICPRSHGSQVADLALPCCTDLCDITLSAPGNALGGRKHFADEKTAERIQLACAKSPGLSRVVRTVSEARAVPFTVFFCLPVLGEAGCWCSGDSHSIGRLAQWRCCWGGAHRGVGVRVGAGFLDLMEYEVECLVKRSAN